MKNKISKKSAKKKAWDAYSLYIRHKYREQDGLISCFTCSKRGRCVGDRFQAGHGMPGRTNSLLFLEEVTRPQCMACNYYANGRYRVFTPKLIKELGIKKYEELSIYAKSIIKYSIQDYLDIAEKYKKKTTELTK